MEDYYKILGVEKDATAEQIKKAYRNLAKTHHPDAGGNEEEFKKISVAYETLSDEEKRRRYDSGGQNPMGGFDPFDIASRMGGFGFNPFGRQQHRQKGADIRIDLNLSLEEIYKGVNKKIRFNHYVGCQSCNGRGGKEATCDGCNGQGVISQVVQTPMGRMMNQRICGKCGGSGQMIVEPCGTCNGSASTIKTEMIDISVPQGIDNGHMFAVKGGGNFTKGGESGDLYVVINEMSTPNMYRQGNDLVKKIDLSYIDFILGNEYILETFDGKIKINIPELSNIGDNLRIKGKGFKKNESVGDMIISLNLVLPKQISEKEKQLLTEIKNNNLKN